MAKMTRDDVYNMVKEIVGASADEIRSEVQAQQDKQVDLLKQFNQSTKPESKLDKATRAARVLRCLAAGRGDPARAVNVAKSWGDDAVVKALEESTLSGGGALIPEDLMEDVIELLRARTVVRASGAMSVPMPNGQLTMPFVDTGVTAQYIGENRCIPKDEPSFGQLQLTAKKLAVLVPISNDLLRDASIAADAIVREDMVRAAAVREDLAFIRGDGTSFTPKGMLNWAPAANKFDSAGTTVANITTDLGDAVLRLEEGNVPLINGRWLFAPRTKKALMTARDGNNNLVWAPEMATGTLMGFPWATTTQIPTNLGTGTDESEVYFADFSSLVIGDSLEVQVEMSNDASYVEGAATQSAFCLDQTVMRLITRHDFGPRFRGAEIAVIEAVQWA